MAAAGADELQLGLIRLHPAARWPGRRFGGVSYNLSSVIDVTIQPLAKAIVPIGWSFQFPPTIWGSIVSKYSIAAESHAIVAGGVIDPQYMGEIKVIIFNLSPSHRYRIRVGDVIAQLVFHQTCTPSFREILAERARVSSTENVLRGAAGFGSTGN